MTNLIIYSLLTSLSLIKSSSCLLAGGVIFKIRKSKFFIDLQGG